MIRLSRLLLVCALFLISFLSARAADSRLEKLDLNDRGILQKVADEATALMIDGTVGKVAGGGAVYFIAPGDPPIASPNKLDVAPTEVLRLRAGDAAFDVQGWAGASVSYTVSVVTGTINPAYPYGQYYSNP